MVVRYLEQKTREKPFSLCERQLEKPASRPAAAKGKCKAKEKDTVEIAYTGQQKVSCLMRTTSEE